MGIKAEQVLKALDDLENTISKASEDDLDQPEGADMGAPGKKMSDMAKKMKKGDLKITHEDEDDDQDAMKADGDEDVAMDGDGDDMEMSKKKKSYAKKSFADDLPQEVQTKIDVSEFLKSLVDHTAMAMDEISERVAKSELTTENRHQELEARVEDVQKSMAKIGVVLKAICERIGVIENQPAARPKADLVAKSQGATERTFESGLKEEGTEPMFKSLSQNPAIAKSQIANALCDLVRKGEATDMDVIGFESSNFIRPEIAQKLKTVLN